MTHHFDKLLNELHQFRTIIGIYEIAVHDIRRLAASTINHQVFRKKVLSLALGAMMEVDHIRSHRLPAPLPASGPEAPPSDEHGGPTGGSE